MICPENDSFHHVIFEHNFPFLIVLKTYTHSIFERVPYLNPLTLIVNTTIYLLKKIKHNHIYN